MKIYYWIIVINSRRCASCWTYTFQTLQELQGMRFFQNRYTKRKQYRTNSSGALRTCVMRKTSSKIQDAELMMIRAGSASLPLAQTRRVICFGSSDWEMGESIAAHRKMKNGRIIDHWFFPIAIWADKLQPVVLQSIVLEKQMSDLAWITWVTSVYPYFMPYVILTSL